MEKRAFFLNGVYENVLREILASQNARRGEVFFLQPYKSHSMTTFANNPPTAEESVRIYISTTDDLNHVRYVAEIVGWEDKRLIPADRLRLLNKRIRELQPKEKEIYPAIKGKECRNLLSIRNLRPLGRPFSVVELTKLSDGQALSPNRSRSGGWSYVHEISLTDDLSTGDTTSLTDKESFDRDFEAKVAESQSLSSQARQERLSTASKFPEKVSIVSTSFRRNSDVVAEVLARANGHCEECKSSAPFLRATDNTPFLEIHHKVMLSAGGEDTIENAQAVCPNCHRRLHFG
jgi:5-methylcytosine-specific restriction protein A